MTVGHNPPVPVEGLDGNFRTSIRSLRTSMATSGLLLLPLCFYIAKCNKRTLGFRTLINAHLVLRTWVSGLRYLALRTWISGPGFQHLDRRTHARNKAGQAFLFPLAVPMNGRNRSSGSGTGG
jgi:hypothetical protein